MAERRILPQVDALARDSALHGVPAPLARRAARAAIAEARNALASGRSADLERLPSRAKALAEELARPNLRRVINLSGIVLNTGLGRARLAEAAVAHVAEVAASHSALELDLESGERGDRQRAVRDLLIEATGAEDALVLNNAAAAVTVSLAALAAGREVLLSRGQMVEIGGAFRMPDIVRQSGCRLIEVGCTNKTRLSDYAEARSENTAVLLRCHPSNFVMTGFVEEPSADDLGAWCRSEGIPFVDDQGSGCLVDTTRFGLPRIPTVQESVRTGALVCASGDKLLGGPQAGLVLGPKAWVAAVRKHPLARATRVDKLTLAAMEATLRLYRDDRLLEIPTWRYLARSAAECRALAQRLRRAIGGGAKVRPTESEVGGGAAPGTRLPTFAVYLDVPEPQRLSRRLRLGTPAVVGRVAEGGMWLDVRTLEPAEVAATASAVRAALEEVAPA